MEHDAERAVTEQVGFIGLGNLGLPMALNLQESSWNLAVFNRTPRKAAPVVERGAVLAEKPADCVTPGGIVVSVLWDSDAVESVVMEGDFLERLGSGVHVCMCTGSPAGAKRLSELHAKHGSLFVEAPVLGRPEAAASRQLWIPIAGPKAAEDRVSAILTGMGAQGIFNFGEEVGAATVVKLLGNFLIISATRTLVRGLAFRNIVGST